MRAGKIGTRKVGGMERGLPELGVGEVGPHEVAPLETDASEIAARAVQSCPGDECRLPLPERLGKDLARANQGGRHYADGQEPTLHRSAPFTARPWTAWPP